MDKISRRDFIRVSSLAGAATIVAACAQPAEAPPPAPVVTEPTVAPAAPAAPAVPAAPPSKFNEAPMLAERVARGELPSVDERVPENPFVITGLDGIGNYGGTMRHSFSGMADGGTISHLNLRGLVNINHEMQHHPYLAESWEVTEDATTFTFHLRKGVKWSDGTPMTAEDFRFYIEDFILNKELTPVVSQDLSSQVGGERVPVQFSAPDDFTIQYKFALPKSLFPYWSGVLMDIPALPSHYFQQFHKDYADADELTALVKAANLDDWSQLFFDKNRYHMNVERPVHVPWLPQNPWTDEYVVAERNPYFWEVDGEGNQLPYVDNLTFRVFSSLDVAIMWAVSGEIDCQSRHIGSFDNYTIYKENEHIGDYQVQIWDRSKCDGVFLNLTTKDERLRKLFNERDFRIAVSYMVDRQEWLDFLYEGFGTHKQYTPPASSPYAYPKLADAYLDYDPDKANELIDGLGYTERDSEGYRVYPDGSGDRIRMNTVTGLVTKPTEMLVDYFKDIGLYLTFRPVDRSLSIELHNNNDLDGDFPGWFDYNLVPLAEPRMWVRGWTTKPWAVAWQAWYDDPTSPIAEEPPEGHWIWDIWDLWDEIQVTADEEQQRQLFFRILDIWHDELPAPCFVGDTPLLQIVKNGLKGIHGGYPYDCCSTIYEYIIDNATWYWDEPGKHTHV